ncbi:NF-kappa-B inhibitor cactus isoform X3 [Chelonus insularis]|uniref:NF-kappa-B inhibitor cactus isoform X3 n=1 Tax=Chelonus insularis TaxID=460826 RepID=UPI00158C5445|nr:NF-kappa-B inhibitor cactus-like isoform X3 [Chelonus insularis]KAG8148382.1 ankyrin repeat domain-containing protein CinsV1-1 [Chelonus insularis]
MDQKVKESEYDVKDQSPVNCWFSSYYVQDYDGNTQLHKFMLHTPIYDKLVEALVDATWPASLLNTQNNYGVTVLHLAAKKGQSDIVRQLIVAGANPYARDSQGCIPLHYACGFNNDKAIVPLTKAISDEEKTKMQSKQLTIPNLPESLYARNFKDESPFHFVARFGYANIVKIFIENKLV